MIILYKKNNYNFQSKGIKIAQFSNWIELQSWMSEVKRGIKDPKIKHHNKFINPLHFRVDYFSNDFFKTIQDEQNQGN
jgi:hypothetical protein